MLSYTDVGFRIPNDWKGVMLGVFLITGNGPFIMIILKKLQMENIEQLGITSNDHKRPPGQHLQARKTAIH